MLEQDKQPKEYTKCPKCGERAVRVSGLKTSGKSLYSCKVCGHSFREGWCDPSIEGGKTSGSMFNTKVERKKAPPYKPSGWQLDPEKITTSKVQFWRNGSMLTAQISNEEAKQMIKDGKAFVISAQAIGALNADGTSNA